jgi:RHS repeat-associated protein
MLRMQEVRRGWGASWRTSTTAPGWSTCGTRYLNPQTGQFTQTDPIGLAGGLNLYGYAGGDPVNFSDPFGLCPGQQGSGTICVAFYIQTKTTLFGSLKGDNRGPSPHSSPSQSRAYVIVDPSNPEAATPVINPTCTSRGRCAAPSARNTFDITSDGAGGFNLEMSLVNSAVPGPRIDASIHFTPDGQGGYQASGTRDGYPSAEAYYYRKDGSVQTIFEQKEGSPRQLWGCCDTKVQ